MLVGRGLVAQRVIRPGQMLARLVVLRMSPNEREELLEGGARGHGGEVRPGLFESVLLGRVLGRAESEAHDDPEQEAPDVSPVGDARAAADAKEAGNQLQSEPDADGPE